MCESTMVIDTKWDMTCVVCRCKTRMEVNSADLKSFKRGLSAEEAFPYVPKKNLELFNSGMCDFCKNKESGEFKLEGEPMKTMKSRLTEKYHARIDFLIKTFGGDSRVLDIVRNVNQFKSIHGK